MDTDYLTPMAYDCIGLADNAADTLKSELAAACGQYRTEDDYLRGILADVREIESDPFEYLDWWNMVEETDIPVFQEKIGVLRRHIEKTLRTPIAERGEPAFR